MLFLPGCSSQWSHWLKQQFCVIKKSETLLFNLCSIQKIVLPVIKHFWEASRRKISSSNHFWSTSFLKKMNKVHSHLGLIKLQFELVLARKWMVYSVWIFAFLKNLCVFDYVCVCVGIWFMEVLIFLLNNELGVLPQYYLSNFFVI